MIFEKHILTIILAVITLSSNVKAEQWTFNIEPYFMATSITGKASIGRAQDIPLDVDFSTILDNLDMAALIHFEALNKSGWGLMFDYGLMDIGFEKTSKRNIYLGGGVRQSIVEALAFYRFKHKNGYFDTFAGVRMWDNEIGLVFDPNLEPFSKSLDVTDDWIDAVIGVRWINRLSNNWNFVAKGDIGGFGLSSDFTSLVDIGFSYKISDLMQLNMKYKALWVDFENDTKTGEVGYFQYDTLTHGPVLGLNFRF